MNIARVQQITESHCGPATLQMLLANMGVLTTQEEISRLAEAESTIEEDGTRPDQLAFATFQLAPHLTFWYKDQATVENIKYILGQGYPIGVEWQGLFHDSEEEEALAEPHDRGHYSIISSLSDDEQGLIIVNPHQDFAYHNRPFPLQTFLRRWWDTNTIINPYSGKKIIVEDLRLLFFLAPQTEVFPPFLNLEWYSPYEENRWNLVKVAIEKV
jgi:hypothetical protein